MVSRGNNRDRASYGGADDRHDSAPAPFGDDSATRYIPRRNDGYNPDVDFASEGATEYLGDDSETKFDQRRPSSPTQDYVPGGVSGGAGFDDSGVTRAADSAGGGQYWAPLSEEERSYGNSGGSGDWRDRDSGTGGDYGRASDSRDHTAGDADYSKRGWNKSAAIVAIAAIVAVVAIVALVLSFSSSGDNAASSTPKATSTRTTSSSPSPTTTSPEETSTNPLDRLDPSGAIDDTRQRLEDELQSLRQTPPSIPGPGELSSGWGTIPQGVVGRSPATVEIELRTNGYQNITVLDAAGNKTNSAAGILGKVAAIDPPEGQMAETSTPVTIYLQ